MDTRRTVYGLQEMEELPRWLYDDAGAHVTQETSLALGGKENPLSFNILRRPILEAAAQEKPRFSYEQASGDRKVCGSCAAWSKRRIARRR
jgi:hypothetical protein